MILAIKELIKNNNLKKMAVLLSILYIQVEVNT